MARRTTRRKKKTSKKTLAQRVTALEKAIKPISIRAPRGKAAIAMVPVSRDMTPPHIRRQLGL